MSKRISFLEIFTILIILGTIIFIIFYSVRSCSLNQIQTLDKEAGDINNTYDDKVSLKVYHYKTHIQTEKIDSFLVRGGQTTDVFTFYMSSDEPMYGADDNATKVAKEFVEFLKKQGVSRTISDLACAVDEDSICEHMCWKKVAQILTGKDDKIIFGLSVNIDENSFQGWLNHNLSLPLYSNFLEAVKSKSFFNDKLNDYLATKDNGAISRENVTTSNSIKNQDFQHSWKDKILGNFSKFISAILILVIGIIVISYLIKIYQQLSIDTNCLNSRFGDIEQAINKVEQQVFRNLTKSNVGMDNGKACPSLIKFQDKLKKIQNTINAFLGINFSLTDDLRTKLESYKQRQDANLKQYKAYKESAYQSINELLSKMGFLYEGSREEDQEAYLSQEIEAINENPGFVNKYTYISGISRDLLEIVEKISKNITNDNKRKDLYLFEVIEDINMPHEKARPSNLKSILEKDIESSERNYTSYIQKKLHELITKQYWTEFTELFRANALARSYLMEKGYSNSHIYNLATTLNACTIVWMNFLKDELGIVPHEIVLFKSEFDQKKHDEARSSLQDGLEDRIVEDIIKRWNEQGQKQNVIVGVKGWGYDNQEGTTKVKSMVYILNEEKFNKIISIPKFSYLSTYPTDGRIDNIDNQKRKA